MDGRIVEILEVLFAVTICIVVVVLKVLFIGSASSSSSSASVYEKLESALLKSLTSILFPTVVCYLYTLLYNYKFYNFLKNFLAIILGVWTVNLSEWDTWGVLVGVSLFDLAAVFIPGGPLYILLKLASARGVEIPSLDFEARPRQIQRQIPIPIPIPTPAVFSRLPPRRSSSSGSSPFLPRYPGETPVPILQSIRPRPRPRPSPRGLILGLGDFILLSVLVGRAAMYGLTMYGVEV